MEIVDKILWWINEKIKNVKSHAKNTGNTELVIAYYKGYETALKEIIKRVTKIKKEEEECQID